MASPPLAEKATFFESLESLEENSGTDDEDFRRELLRRRRGRSFFGRPPAPPQLPTQQIASTAQELGPLKRAISAPTPMPISTYSSSQPPDVVVVTSTPAETPLPYENSSARPTPRRSTTDPSASSRKAKATSRPAQSTMPPPKKRKKGPLENAVPEALQIFKDLSFYYIPNNDISQLRKLRIGKAKEYGVRWVRDIDEATHVIVDKKLSWKDIEMEFNSIADPGKLSIVDEEYPLDCIKFKILCNPDQFRYKVPGCPVTAKMPDPSPNARQEAPSGSSESLQVKTKPQHDPQKWDYVPRVGTPPHEEDSSDSSLDEVEHQPAEHIPESQGHEGHRDSAEDVVIPSSQPRDTNEAGPAEGQKQNRTGNHVPTSRHGPKDGLSEYIEIMQQFSGLPLDEDEDDAGLTNVADEDDSEPEGGSDDERNHKKSARLGQKKIRWEERFACNQGGTKNKSSESADPNARTIEILQSMCDYYDRINDHFRTIAYRKAITALRRQTVKITTKEEAHKIPSIGPRLAEKIEEIVSTNRLQRLEYAQMEPTDKVLEKFLKIYGVGTNQARKWIAQGFHTLEDLKEKAKLTTNQRLGIDRYDDLNTRIPRKEVEALGEYVKKTAARMDPQVELLIGGSYRRGSDSSGDIDFIVTKKNTTSAADLVPFLQKLIAVLTDEGFLTAALASLHSHRSGKEGPGSKWHGCCVLPRIPGGINDSDGYRPIWRRIDFLLVAESEYGAALIYFTGNDIFNRSIRLLASRKGMRLNQRGLYKELMRGPGRTKVTEGELLEGRDEKRIFEILGVQWREPWERWC